MTPLVVPYRPDLAPAFERLNRAWIEPLFGVEESDRRVFADPEAAIIRPGGQIFFALLDGAVVGTCAALPHGPCVVELAKMAVDPAAQGRGIGRRLGEAVIAHARRAGAERVVLLSSSRLPAALALYRRLGFEHRPLPPDTGYRRADVYMELRLAAEEPAPTVAPRGEDGRCTEST